MQEEKAGFKNLYYGFWFIFIVALCYTLVLYDKLATILAGVAILLIGMTNLSSGFKSFSGGLLEKILAKSTSTKLKSIIFGVISTTIMQSSSLVCVISISFLSAGLISLGSGIAIIFGANLGNTASSWLIVGLTSMKISMLAIPLIISGVLLFFQKDSLFKGLGNIFIGIGFFFLGVDYIKSGFEDFKEVLDFSKFDFTGFKGVIIFLGLGALLTGVIQSSTATIALIIAALLSNQISLENSLAATLGTSVGGVVTALLASLSTNIEGKKLAVANCIFNFGIAIIVIAIFPYFVDLINLISSLFGIENLALKTALFHTLFNLIAVILFSFFTSQIVALLDKIIKAPVDKNKDKPLYLDANLVSFSDTALEALYKESEHLYNNAFAIIAHTLGFSRRDIKSDKSFAEILKNKKWFSKNINLDYLYQNRIKVLFEAIIDFSTKAQIYIEDEDKNHEIFRLKLGAKNISEATKDLKIIQANIKKYSNASNLYLAQEYDELRSNAAELLRSIEELRLSEDEKRALIIQNFDKAKEILRELDENSLKKTEKLIKENKITPTQGISLLNDTSFLAKMSSEIIEAVEIIFARKHTLSKDQSE
ncbi:Na/Pi-cotransporter [Campylobacter sp. MIT 99-7217]|uniref:Na/Pi cotransporter family protein n=1 Tax=Campylobacter sp. MIT 99-7217 TaxID=535091 RepID=UPI001157485F|nr:Na/Pi symporter [Campylobacter sp. MIT 99-7217]TQR33056.1 Na/Pi-cotransporter [Campylobacter sp. MIT 99-7217]